MPSRHSITAFVLLALSASHTALAADTPRPLKLLFLGDNGHHQPAVRFKQLQPVMASRHITLTYTDVPDDLNAATLAKYDGLVLYANIDEIAPDQAKALLDYVAGGKGFIPLHCASYCFRNNADVVALIGAQFQRHETGTFRTILAEREHPVMRGFRGFESWDETYVHTKHNEKDRTVLEYRQEGDRREPWTWVRTHGKGRVFYTAWGHDGRTWGNPGFQNLVERGIRWACGDDPAVVPAFADRPEMTPKRTDVKPFEYVEANVPFYPAGKNWGTVESGPRKMQKPLSAEESIKHFVTPRGFEVKLFAAEPDIGKPLAMAWDERGRLWLCESVDYPNELQPKGEGRDRIRICEDTNNDGRADRFTVFAEKLSIPTSLAFCRGGILVQNGRETLFLKDTDGDDKADLRRAIITGWSAGDTHGGVSNFQYGLDGWYWGMQGYNDSAPVIADGKATTSFRQGFFRFRVEPDGDAVKVTALEFVRSTDNNTWGLGFSEEGDVFGSTANGNPSVHMPLANRYYESVRGWSSSVLHSIAESNRFDPITENVRQVDHHGGFTAAAGHALYTARAWPREYWNRTAFVCEPTGHLIATFVLTSDGTTFHSKNSWNILASDDEWSSPTMAEVGPDGQLWVIDWYNYIVQHNPTPAGFKTGKGMAYETDLRDKRHGRIYRVVWKGDSDQESAEAKTAAKSLTTLHGATPAQLIAALSSDNFFWRRQAQRLLVELGGTSTAGALLPPLDPKAADGDLSAAAIHALWTIHGLKETAQISSVGPEELLTVALKHPSAGVRRAAILTLDPRYETVQTIVAMAQDDPHPQVRLAALQRLAEIRSPGKGDFAGAGPGLARLAVDASIASDPALLDAWTSAAAQHDTFVLLNLATANRVGQKIAPAILPRIAIVAENLGRRAPRDGMPVRLVAALSEFDPAIASAIVAGLARGWPKDRPPEQVEIAEKSFVAMATKLPAASRGSLVQLASRWGSKALEAHIAEISRSFVTLASDEKARDADRVAAARQLIEFRRTDASAATALLDLITPKTSPELAAGLIDAAGLSESSEVGRDLVERLPALSPGVRAAALRMLLSRVEWTRVLLDGVDSGRVQLADLSLDQKQALAAHPDNAIAARVKPLLAKGGGLPNPDRQKVLDDLLPLTKVSGDPVAGKETYKKQCQKCHTHSGEGTKIGPDLTGMAVHPKHELLTHIIDPSRSVEGNFRVYTVVLDDGRVMTGLLASENRTAIEIFDVEGKKHSLQRDEIEELKASPKSLMPEGFEKQVSRDDIANLLEFLTQRGKFLPIPLTKAATVVSTKGMFFSEEGDPERLIFPDWSPKTFAGVPFQLIDPQDGRTPNAILFYGPQGRIPPKMPKSVLLPCNAPAKAIHFLSGVSGWGHPLGEKGSVSLIVRLKYADNTTEDHELKNGIHFADYIRRVDVPESQFAFGLRGQQLRYLSVIPKRSEPIESIELRKGPDATAPIVMAITVETK